jgi:hypothetical protein
MYVSCTYKVKLYLWYFDRQSVKASMNWIMATYSMTWILWKPHPWVIWEIKRWLRHMDHYIVNVTLNILGITSTIYIRWVWVKFRMFQQYFSYFVGSVLLIEETGVPGEKHRPVASHWQTLSHNVVSSTPRHQQDSNSQL